MGQYKLWVAFAMASQNVHTNPREILENFTAKSFPSTHFPQKIHFASFNMKQNIHKCLQESAESQNKTTHRVVKSSSSHWYL